MIEAIVSALVAGQVADWRSAIRLGFRAARSREPSIGRAWQGTSRIKPRPPKPRKPRAKRGRKKPSVVDVACLRSLPPLPAVVVKPRPFGSLKPGQCRFGLNSPERGRMSELLCCAAPVRRQGAVYCAEHARLAVSRVSVSPASAVSVSVSPRAPSARAPAASR